MKNLKMSKTLVAYIISGAIGITGGLTIGNIKAVNDNKRQEETSLKKHEKIKKATSSGITVAVEQPEVTINETATPEPTPYVFVYNYPKKTYGYAKKELILKNSKKKKIAIVNQYQKVKLVKKVDNLVLVKYDNKKGYVNRKNIKKFDSEFIDVDISDQKVKYYDKNGNIIVKTPTVTGCVARGNATPPGIFEIGIKERNRKLKHTWFVNYWMPFNGGIGLHDASWRYGVFGGEIYKTHGSHGCVNLPHDAAEKIYENSSVGTKVLVHK